MYTTVFTPQSSLFPVGKEFSNPCGSERQDENNSDLIDAVNALNCHRTRMKNEPVLGSMMLPAALSAMKCAA